MGRPKPQSLCATVAEHHSALEVDLRREGVELLDLWCGCLSWRTVAQHIRWLPKTAALFQSMRLARPAAPVDPAGPSLVVVDHLEALRNGTPEHVAELLLGLLNRAENRDYAETPTDRRGPWEPTLPPGYAHANADDTRPDWDSDEARAYRELLSAAS